MRFGIILDKDHGALSHMVRPIKLGVGGRYGNGKQWVSWIALRDVVSVTRAAIDAYEPPAAELAQWDAERDDFIERVYSALTRQASKNG